MKNQSIFIYYLVTFLAFCFFGLLSLVTRWLIFFKLCKMRILMIRERIFDLILFVWLLINVYLYRWQITYNFSLTRFNLFNTIPKTYNSFLSFFLFWTTESLFSCKTSFLPKRRGFFSLLNIFFLFVLTSTPLRFALMSTI